MSSKGLPTNMYNKILLIKISITFLDYYLYTTLLNVLLNILCNVFFCEEILCAIVCTNFKKERWDFWIKFFNHVHILFMMPFMSLRWSLLVIWKHQSGYSSCLMHFAGFSVPTASTHAGPSACRSRRRRLQEFLYIFICPRTSKA